jgi:NAD-dependent deacetylase
MTDLLHAALPRCSCGYMLQPNIALLNGYINEASYDNAIDAAQNCDLLIMVGASGVQSHTKTFFDLIKSRAVALIVEINVSPTYLSNECNFVLRGSSDEIIPALL